MLAMLCRPLLELMVSWVNGRHRAAAAMTAFTLLLVFLPLGDALILAGWELAALGNDAIGWKPQNQPFFRETTVSLKAYLSPEDWQRRQDSVKNSIRGITSDILQKTQSLISNVIGFVIRIGEDGLVALLLFLRGPGNPENAAVGVSL